jgi:WD40 repeat protein
LSTGAITPDNAGRVALLASMKHGDTAISSLTFSPDGTVLVSGSRDGTALTWDPATGKQLAYQLTGEGFIGDLVYHPDGNLIAGATPTIFLWDMATGGVFAFPDSSGNSNLIYSADGKILFSVSSYDHTVEWNATSGQLAASQSVTACLRAWLSARMGLCSLAGAAISRCMYGTLPSEA